MSKCIGCGVKLQNKDNENLGYTSNLDNNLCERCFRIRNYNDYKFVFKDNNNFINILKDVSKTNDLVLLVVDLFNINKSLSDISKYIKNDILLVLSKRDILPKSCYDKKLIEYFNNYNLNIIDTVVISSNKNYNLDTLYDKINKYKKTSRVYAVGFTNSGKSTLINKIIYNYSDSDTVITTSNLPSTTIDSIEVKINNDLILIDTPGLIEEGDITNTIDEKVLKHIVPKKEIKPITYQIKNKQTLLIEDLVRMDVCNKTNMTVYMSNIVNIKRVYRDVDNLKNLKKYELDVKEDNDVVIAGLGFIKFTHKTRVNVYSNSLVYVRKSLI